MALELDGERAIPELMGGCLVTRLLLQEHVARYELARRYAAGRRILDIACGAGYGTRMLRERTDKEAVGVDISAEALEYAEARYGAPGIMWVQADADEFASFKGFDMVVSFETIEHLADPARFVARVFSGLPPGGIFCVSAPVVRTTHLVRFHKHDFTVEQFRGMVTGAGFEIIEELPASFTCYPWHLIHAKLTQPPASRANWGWSWRTAIRMLLCGFRWESLALVCRKGKAECRLGGG